MTIEPLTPGVSLARDFKVSVSDKQKWRAMAKQILIEQADLYHVFPSQILARGRTPEVVRARHSMMWRIRNEMCGISLTEIGRLIDRDHTSVLHGIREHQKRIDQGTAK